MLTLAGRKVLFVGARRNAIRAAHQLGIKIYLISKSKIPTNLSSLCEEMLVQDFNQDPAKFAEVVLDQLKQKTFDAVIATTEGGVLHAAIIRERLLLSGLDFNRAQRCRNKFLMKQSMISAGITCTPFRRIDHNTSYEDLVDHLQIPFIVKDMNSSGGRGFVTVRTKKDFEIGRFRDHMAEAYISGKEFSIESFVSSGKIIFKNITEYIIPGWASIVPYELSDELQKLIEEFNDKVIHNLGIERGMIHLEGFISSDGIVFNELASRPPGGYIMDLIKYTYGFCPWQLYLKCELFENVDVPKILSSNPHGVLILHPSVGQVKAIHGIEDCRKRKELVRLRLKCSAGDFIAPRVGTGQSKGYVIVHGSSRNEVLKNIQSVNQEIVFEYA